ncbi:MAG: hypothetical protein BYD32DRAFT_413101 [Podila humilis]|nr:MAG: hypothetical protein BYD32DRAFT_413101 [Podila humilis]
MASNSRKQRGGLTFLQPNTVVSSRAAIFEDDFQSGSHHHSHASPHSNRAKGLSEDDEDEDEELSKSILAKLYGQLEGAMEIEEDSPRIATGMSDTKEEEDMSHTSSLQQDGSDQETNEDTAMEFRLFATQDTPTKISLVHKPAQEVTQLLEATHRLKREVDENLGSERMQQIKEAAIDAMTVLEQAKIPWARTFFEHKVIHVPFHQPNPNKKTKPSRAKREWAKKVKSGEISLATAQATARKDKVSESYGRKPFMERKGLGRNTIDAGTDSNRNQGSTRGGRGGARGGRGAARGGRGASRGGRGVARGGSPHGSRDKDAKDAKDAKEGDHKETSSAVVKDDSTSKKRDATSQESKAPSKLIKKPKTNDQATSKLKAKPEGSTPTVTPKATPSSSSPATAPTAPSTTTTTSPKSLPPKKPKAKKDKPMSKIDNIMALLMSK